MGQPLSEAIHVPVLHRLPRDGSAISLISPNEEPDLKTYAIIGAALEVHRILGGGFLERVYQEALACELRRRNIPFERDVELPVTSKGENLNCKYRIDFLCHDEILVELKAMAELVQARKLKY